MSAPLSPEEARALTKAQLRAHIAALRPLLVPGAVFDTFVEQGCTVITSPDAGVEDTGFDATDSEGVLCHFGIVMVGNVR